MEKKVNDAPTRSQLLPRIPNLPQWPDGETHVAVYQGFPMNCPTKPTDSPTCGWKAVSVSNATPEALTLPSAYTTPSPWFAVRSFWISKSRLQQARPARLHVAVARIR